MSDILPVSRFSPVSGVFIDRKAHAITISGTLELYGPEATRARAASVATAINSAWTASFDDGYKITCKMIVTYRAPGTRAGNAGQIEAVKIAGPSHYSPAWKSITLNANETHAFGWTAAHEFGHMIGLKDRYSESAMSKLRGKLGYSRTNTIHDGYDSNIMGKHQGVTEKKNVQDLISENAPWWFSQDDRVRAWVTSHKLAEIRQVSTANKIRMIEILMGGWISDADLKAILRILESVETADEGNAIRDGINDVGFSSLGQRFTYQAALSHVPY